MVLYQYIKGCPGHNGTLRSLKDAMKILQLPEAMLECECVENSSRHNFFLGSPSISINGVALITGKKPVGFHFSCRTYQDGDTLTHTLRVEELVNHLRAALNVANT